MVLKKEEIEALLSAADDAGLNARVVSVQARQDESRLLTRAYGIIRRMATDKDADMRESGRVLKKAWDILADIDQEKYIMAARIVLDAQAFIKGGKQVAAIMMSKATYKTLVQGDGEFPKFETDPTIPMTTLIWRYFPICIVNSMALHQYIILDEEDMAEVKKYVNYTRK